MVSTAGLSTGYSYSLMHTWASNPNTTIILPDRGEVGSMSNYLYDYWILQTSVLSSDPETEPELSIQMKHDFPTSLFRKAPLTGADLEEFIVAKNKSDAKIAADAEILRRQSRGMESDDEEEEEVQALNNLELDANSHAPFDFYVKNTSLHSTFFKTSTTFKMFPVKDYRTKYDDYGEILDPNDFVQGEYHNALAQAAEDQKPAIVPVQNKEREEVPFKYVKEDVVLSFRCRLVFIDFEGRVDGKSIRNIIPQVAPRKIVCYY